MRIYWQNLKIAIDPETYEERLMLVKLLENLKIAPPEWKVKARAAAGGGDCDDEEHVVGVDKSLEVS